MRRSAPLFSACLILPLLILGCAAIGSEWRAAIQGKGAQEEESAFADFGKIFRRTMKELLTKKWEDIDWEKVKGKKPEPLHSKAPPKKEKPEKSEKEALLTKKEEAASAKKNNHSPREPSPRFVVPRDGGEHVASLPPSFKAPAALPAIGGGEVIDAIDAAEKALDRARRRGARKKNPESFSSSQELLDEAKDAFLRGRMEESFLSAFLARESAARLPAGSHPAPGSKAAVRDLAFEAILKADRALRDARPGVPYGVTEGHPYSRARALLRLAVKSYRGGKFKEARVDAELAEKRVLLLIP